MGFNVNMYRSARIPNLHPIAFSLSINEYVGDVGNAFVEPENGMITVNINNSGWGEDWFIFNLYDISGLEIISESIFVQPFEDAFINLDVSSLSSAIFNLEVYPSQTPERLQTFEFNLHNTISLGDMNSDGALNVLDVVILSNLILADDDSNPAGDLNQDGSQNILDIVTLVNIILGY